MLVIRPAVPTDCGEVAEIYRHYVETSVATFALEAPDESSWVTKLAETVGSGLPFLVAEDPEVRPGLLGYALLGAYRGKSGWRHTTEDSIYLRPEAAGRGLGRTLLQALIDSTDRTVVRNIIAVISAEVQASIVLHQQLGFTEVGRMAEVGYKFDRWLGCVYLQLSLGESVAAVD